MEPSDGRVAVVGDDRAAVLRHALASLPYRTADRAAADAVVAVGDDAIRDVLVDTPDTSSVPETPDTSSVPETPDTSSDPDVPVIPVGSRRLATDLDVAERRLGTLLEAALRGAESGDGARPDGVRRADHPILAVDAGDGAPLRAAFDVALVTEEPARISEFAVDFVGGANESFRADGVVAATPLGSDGYANAAGGPVVEPGGGLSVVPIAPFSTRTDAWVAADRLSLSVERETESVALVVDGRERAVVAPRRPIAIEAVDSVSLVTFAGGRRARRSETL